MKKYFLLNELKGDNICYSNTSTDPFWTAATYMDGATTPQRPAATCAT